MAALLLVLLAAGALVQVVWLQAAWTTLLALVPALLVLLLLMKRQASQTVLLTQVQAVAHAVAHGQFGQRLTGIPDQGELKGLCWDMNDMLDQLEACFREQATALRAAANANYTRKAQTTGLRGGFHASQSATNASLQSMEDQALHEQRDAAEKVIAQQREQRIASENLRIRNALDRCSTNVMIADAGNVIIYMNETVTEMMRRNQAELQKALPQFDAGQLIGQNIDVFHKNPAHQRGMLADLKSNYRTQIRVGKLTFSLSASPILDSTGARMGTVVEWADRTQEVATEKEVAELVQAASLGELSARLSMEGKVGFFAALTTGMNQLMDTSEQGLNDVAQLLAAFAEGDLTQRIERDYQGLFGRVKDSANSTAGSLARVLSEVRAAADDKAVLVFEAERDVVLELLEAAPGGWLKVRHRDGQSGFVKLVQVWGS